jgi:predicted DNA-binding protein with PD1-like motif
MRSKLISDENGLKTWVLVFDKDDEVKKSLLRFASEHGFRGAQITAIGAFSEATFGFFDRESKSYQEIPIKNKWRSSLLPGTTMAFPCA